jgi:hypothetical protein
VAQGEGPDSSPSATKEKKKEVGNEVELCSLSRLVCGAGGQTHSLAHARQVLPHCTASPALVF